MDSNKPLHTTSTTLIMKKIMTRLSNVFITPICNLSGLLKTLVKATDTLVDKFFLNKLIDGVAKQQTNQTACRRIWR